MNKELLCYVDSMALVQKVIAPDGANIAVSSEHYAEGIIELCNKYNINKVHLFGNQYYLEGVSENIRTQEILSYSQNKIEIEVN